MRRIRTALSLLLAGASTPALAAPREFVLDIELPRINVAEYHKPYVSAWVEDMAGKPVGQLALWYDTRKDNGKKYLPDLKTWWRKGGRSLTVPIAGVTGATRAPGRSTVSLPAAGAPLAKLPAGNYNLVVEAAREAGGREVVKAPFAWKPGGTVNAAVKGTGELGAVRLSAR